MNWNWTTKFKLNLKSDEAILFLSLTVWAHRGYLSIVAWINNHIWIYLHFWTLKDHYTNQLNATSSSGAVSTVCQNYINWVQYNLEIIIFKFAIPLGWILSIFVSYHIISIFKSCVGITTNSSCQHFQIFRCSFSVLISDLFRESESKSWQYR